MAYSTLSAPHTSHPPTAKMQSMPHTLADAATTATAKHPSNDSLTVSSYIISQFDHNAHAFNGSQGNALLVRLTHHRINAADDSDHIGQKVPFHQLGQGVQRDKGWGTNLQTIGTLATIAD